MNHHKSDISDFQLSQLPRSLIASRCTRMHDARQLPPLPYNEVDVRISLMAGREMTLNYLSHTLLLQQAAPRLGSAGWLGEHHLLNHIFLFIFLFLFLFTPALHPVWGEPLHRHAISSSPRPLFIRPEGTIRCTSGTRLRRALRPALHLVRPT